MISFFFCNGGGNEGWEGGGFDGKKDESQSSHVVRGVLGFER